jgi:chromosome segregation ATPase
LSLLRRKLHDLTEIVDVFVSKLEERSDRVEELTKLNAALESDVKQQKDEISRIKAQLVDERSERILFQTESKRAAEAKLEEKRREFARLLGDKDDDLASLQGKLEESEKQGQARVEEGKQQLAVTNTELGDLRGQIKTLKAQRENLKKDLEAQTSRVNALETERQQLAKEAEEIKQTSREKEPEQNLSDVRAQLVALQAENTDLRENAKKRESRIHGLKKRVGEVEVKLASLHIASKTPVPQQHDTPGLVAHASEQAGKDLDAAQSRITELEKQSSTLQHDLQDSETELSRLRSDLSKANEQIETHERDLLNERQANEVLQSQIAQLVDDLRQKEDEALKIREHITPEEDATTSLRVQGLSQDLKTEKSRGNRLQTELGESVAENERLKQALVDLEGRADDAMKAREEAERQLSVSQTDRDAKFMAEIERIQAELQEKGRQLSDFETRRDASIESDAQIKREIGELHGNLRDAELRYREEKRRREELLSQKAVLESKQTQLTQQVHRLTSARRQAQSDVVRNLQQEIATKEETITGLETQIQLLGTRLKDIQGFAFDLKRNAARRKIDDGFIRDRLEYEFRDGTRHWAKTWGANKFTTDLQQSDMGELRVQLQKVAEVRTDVRLVVQLETIDPRLVVDALLSRYLVDNIFPESSNASGGHDEVSMESALSKFLIELYKAFMHGSYARLPIACSCC